MAGVALRDELENAGLPVHDGWSWLYDWFDARAPRGTDRRQRVCAWFFPARPERWRDGLLYRLLGVPLFGALIPTGGILVRRVTGARMAPYTLAATSLRGAREFYFRACVFESLHMPFLLTMVGLAGWRLAQGQADLALQDTAVNLALNVYPILHHRRTRWRIVRLLDRRPTARMTPDR